LIGPHNGQAWSFIHLAGASIAASKLMGLDAERTADALSLAFMQPNYMLFPGFFSGAKLLTASVPATAGLQAAQLAASGLRGPRHVLEPDGGFLLHFSFAPQTWALGGLGRAWVSDSLAYKPVPGCAYIDSGVEAAESLLADGLTPGDIGEVEVRAGKLTTTMEHLGETFAPQLSTVRTTFSLRYSLAALFAHGRLTPREIARPDPALIERWAERISLRYDPSLTLTTIRALQEFDIHPLAGLGLRDLVRMARLARVLGPPLDLQPSDLLLGPTMLRSWRRRMPEFESLEGLKFPFPAEVTVRLSGGGTRRALVEIPRGAPGRPLDEVKETVRQKFLQEAGPALGERAKEATGLVEKMERLASPGALMELLPGEYR
jgi:2-methylcitrate dehydratase PrpD